MSATHPTHPSVIRAARRLRRLIFLAVVLQQMALDAYAAHPAIIDLRMTAASIELQLVVKKG